ncbi:cyclic pyranopterin monophosphate synthase MoaC [Haloprofundus sp. MHR1]|uniref:cyclic pyranopterin monophosphate synthase MoaC n=1 Tax=Haloprofundus sp. MHR1 TaxID=2572921 RepID=UPI0010BF4D95|nr:cyclic pyranopterin monophosphate synthase MoaC [Haloprofundus sp. MHR1]QCJ48208.1 cyclic pyranopterin monophosphate synthase MoaC [Haloprofundus sp. MHR1]
MTEKGRPTGPADHSDPAEAAGDADADPADHSNPDEDDPEAETYRTSSRSELTHTDEGGNVQMVDVGAKPDTARRAEARGEIRLRESTIDAIGGDEIEKGDVLATARVGAVQAVKHTWETIPMCHQIPITNVDTEFDVRDDRVVLTVGVETTGKTGCEMEALEGVTTGLNVVWDMVKAAEKDDDGQYPDTSIRDVEVVTKEKQTLG